MSDHHHNRSSSYNFKDSYGSSSSKRYHSPGDSGRIGMGGSGGGGGGGGYYDSVSKRSRSDAYGAGSSHLHTSSSSSRYNDYSSSSGSHGSLMSNRFNKPSTSHYYDGPSGSKTSKYHDDFKGNSSRNASIKSSVRRIPPPLSAPSSYSSKLPMKSSIGSTRPLPLMKLNAVTSGGGSRDYGGSRLRTAPPEHHSSSYVSSNYRKQEFKKPAPYNLKYASGSSSYNRISSGASSVFRRGNMRPQVTNNMTNKIRRRNVESFEDRRKRITAYHNSRREALQKKSPRYYDKPKSRERSSKDKEKSKDSSETKSDDKEKIKDSTDHVDGELPADVTAVVVEEVGGDSEEEDNAGKVSELDEKEERKRLDRQGKSHNVENDSKIDEEEAPGEKEDHVGEKSSTEEHHKERKPRSEKKFSADDREGSPSSRALLKLYCKYCDVRYVTFREYSTHLRSFSHTKAMNNSVTDMRRQLSKLRTQQRDDQRKLEKEEKVLSDTTSYCRVCELNFRSDPKEHEANVLHNEIKTVIYQRCDICEIDFRIWKVYLYHHAALEHVKRVAMKELKEAELTGENVKGTNLSQEELGLDLVEIRTVFFCNACVRYIPIKGEELEGKTRHCMTLTHIKYVEEFRQREKRLAERERKRIEREEKDAKIKKEREEKDIESLKIADETKNGEGDIDGNSENNEILVKTEESGNNKEEKQNENIVIEGVKVKTEPDTEENMEEDENAGEPKVNEDADADVDEDEIELHAGDDVPEDDEEDPTESIRWNRRTRSSGRRGGSSSKSSH